MAAKNANRLSLHEDKTNEECVRSAVGQLHNLVG